MQERLSAAHSSSVKLTVFVLDAALVSAVAARLRLELDVAELQHGRHQLQHRLHLVVHEAHDLHGILGGQKGIKVTGQLMDKDTGLQKGNRALKTAWRRCNWCCRGQI